MRGSSNVMFNVPAVAMLDQIVVTNRTGEYIAANPAADDDDDV